MELKTLSGSLIRTIADPTSWQAALGQLCAYTGADKALISLRDNKTAAIVIPEDVADAFASPLIYGFDEDIVAAFLSDFGEVDPWTEIERQNYPYFPYAMSRYMAPADLRKTAFWTWLEPQGIDDCVVCEMGRTDTFWVAVNLYFKTSEKNRAAWVIDRLKDVLPVLKEVWTSGREMQLAKSALGSLHMVLSAIDEPAALMTQDGVLVAVNTPMHRFLAALSADGQPSDHLVLPANIPLQQQEGLDPVTIARAPATGFKGEARIAAFRSEELQAGEPRQTYLVTLVPPNHGRGPDAASTKAEVWDPAILTERERMLVRLVATGQKFTEAQDEMGVSYPRVMQLWKSAREKLGVADVTELRLKHQLNQRR